ncbi:MAG: tRNA pseudouridine(13) synthase TruD [Deltaproteobacteria bacterium]|nr:tRNA pseudouridine(13) synthase TruD [Deltaproteobacteria bacterium]
MKIKQRPEDFVVREGFRFEEDPRGAIWVYRMDKQKVSTLQAIERLGREFGVRRRAFSVCGLKDKQGRTEQLIGVEGGSLGETDVVQSGDLRLTLLGRTNEALGTHNITSNRFEVTVRDLAPADTARAAESAREVERVGVVNYFDSQRFGFLKHGQGFIAKPLLRGDFEGALKAFMATPSELDRSDDAKVKTFWRDHWGEWELRAPTDAAKIYAPLLRRLREDPKDFKGAFLHIERRTRMMALFEFQSYVWNEGVRRYLMNRLPASELVGLRYQAGALVLPRAMSKELAEELHEKTFPLLAPDTRFTDPQIEEAALSALSAQQLTLDQLVVPGTRELFFKHEERPLFVMPDKLRVNDPRPDELNRGKQKQNLSFTLPPGAYATLVVRRIFWFAAEGARALGKQEAQAHAAEATQRMLQEQRQQPGKPGRKGDRGAHEKPGPQDKTAGEAKPRWGQPQPGEERMERLKEGAAKAEQRVNRDRNDRSEPMEPGAEPKQALGFRARQKLKKAARAESRSKARAARPQQKRAKK